MKKKSLVASIFAIAVTILSCSNIENRTKKFFPNLNSTEAPKVMYSIPSQNQTGVPKDQTILIQFNKDIDQSSCTNAFYIQPPVSGLFEFTGSTMKFKASEYLKGGITYVVNVSKTCEDKEGRDLDKAYSINFSINENTTPPELTNIFGKTIANGCSNENALVEIANFKQNSFNSSGLCKNTPLKLNFTRSMNIGSVEGNLIFSAELYPVFRWSDNNKGLEISFNNPLENAKTYIMTLSKEAHDLGEKKFSTNYTLSFSAGIDTKKPELALIDGYVKNANSCNPGILASNLFADGLRNRTGVCSSAASNSANSPIFIHFSEDMDIAKSDSSFIINPQINGIKSWSKSIRQNCGSTGQCGSASLLTFTPTENWSPSTTYTISISPNASDLSGNSLGDNTSLAFTIGSDYTSPKILFADGYIDTGIGCNPGTLASTMDPANGIKDKAGVCSSNYLNSLDTPISIYFSEDMEINSVNSSISIYPDIPVIKSWSTGSNPNCGSTGICIGNNLLTIAPLSPWENTTYTFAISSGAFDLDGNPIAPNSSFSFRVGLDSIPPGMDNTQPNFLGDQAPLCSGTGLTPIPNLAQDICHAQGNALFRFRFSEAMDKSSVMSAFSISPIVSGNFSWTSPMEMVFSPSQSLELFKQYRIEISKLAKDLAGNSLISEFINYFTTGDGSGSMDVSPPFVTGIFSDLETGIGGCDGSANENISPFDTGICTDNSGTGSNALLEIRFSEPMNEVGTAAEITISPNVSGIISWIAPDTIRLIFTRSLAPNTQYSLTIGKNSSDLAGNKMTENFTTFFLSTSNGGYPGVISIFVPTGSSILCNSGTGALLDILSSVVDNACTGNPQVSPVSVLFTESMNQSTAEGGFSISPNVSGRFTWPSADRLEFLPDNPFEPGKRYEILISTNAEDSGGNKIQNSVQGSFVASGIDLIPPDINCPSCGASFEINGDLDNCGIIPDDIVAQKNGSTISTNVCAQSPIKIEFSEPMNTASVQNSISFSPNADYTTSWTGNTLTIRPLYSLNSDKTYVLQISASAKDISGNQLKNDITIGFRTENLSPVVYAIGLESQTNCLNYSGTPSTGHASGGNWLSANCFWDKTLPVLSPNNYKFRGGNSPCYSNSAFDNLRIIFSSQMDPVATVNGISLRRISPPYSSILKSSYYWSDNSHVITIAFSEDKSTGCASNQAGSMDLFHDPLGDPLPNYPFYILEIDTTARDIFGRNLNSPFQFIIEGE